jgi:hypothetical protein
MRMKLGATIVALLLGITITQLAAEEKGKPQPQLGDYGYNHHLYHNHNGTGVIDELNKQSQIVRGHKCCDSIGECRETQVNLAETQVLLDGRWCDIPATAFKSWTTPLPDSHSKIVACAGKGSPQICPTIWCIALRPKGT